MPAQHGSRNLLWCIAGAALSLVPDCGWAAAVTQGSRGIALEEILVTARRRDESPVDVPMSLTYLDGDTLDGLQYRALADIVSLSPGVVAYTGNNSPQLAIRGVVAPGDLSETGNAVYVDEVYVSGLMTVLPGFYDIQSVQVLKGPQAGLYGRNTTGGAVLITTAQPTDQRFARLDTSYAQYDTMDVNGTANLPLSDAVRLRTTLWYNDIGGSYYQGGVTDHNIDGANNRGGRLALALLPNERTALTLSAESVELKAAYAGFDGVVEGAQLAPAPQAPESRRNVLRDDLGNIHQNADWINGKLDVNTDAGTFVAVAGWRKVTLRDDGSDSDGTALSASYSGFLADPTPLGSILPAPQVTSEDNRDTSRTLDLRFRTPDDSTALRAMFGASYYQETVRFFGQTIPVRDFAQILTALGQNGSFTADTEQETTSWAGFTELIWSPVPRIEVTADLRYTRDRKDVHYHQLATGYYSTNPDAGDFTLDTGKTFDNWSPGITLAYKPDDTLTAFAKYVRGFRAGGFNTPVNNPDYLAYDPEKAESYEVGLKCLLLDQRLNAGASVFYQRLNNTVLPQIDFGALGLLTPQQNAGAGETTGLELDLTAHVTDELLLIASAGAYQNSLSESGVLNLSQRPFAPDYTASLAVNYQHPLTATVTAITRLGFRHRSGGVLPGPDLKMDSYNLLDAQFGIGYRQFEFAAFVVNALDDNYILYNTGLTGTQRRFASSPTARALVQDKGTVFGVRFTVVM